MKFELARVERLNLGLSAGAVAASLALVSPHFAGSLAAGAFLEALNLGAIHRGAKRLFTGEIEGARTWIGLFSMRFLTLAAAIFVTMQAGADVAALLIGLSITMPATLIDAGRSRDARSIVEKGLSIAGDICIYTNHNRTIEELDCGDTN